MKKWFWAGAAVAVLVIAVVVAVNIEYEKPVSQEKLPAAAQSFLEQYYPQGNIALVMKSLDDMEVTYETIYTDGVRVEFDRRGEWKNLHRLQPIFLQIFLRSTSLKSNATERNGK